MKKQQPDKTIQENTKLREAVKKTTLELAQKKRELAIESALERVRTVAMTMKKPEDMLKVCRVISKELERLGIKEIRNIQTAIVNEENAVYLNYEYFRLYNKTTVTPIAYKEHKDTNRFVRKMLNDPAGFFTNSLKGVELKEWMSYQAKSGQFEDHHLRKAKSLHYYFYSTGPGSLGISTYSPLNKDEIALFKRFRNVFQLAYQRFIDIQKAEDQAYEARIEVSLEKVRAEALAMHKPADLLNVCKVLFKELRSLGFIQLRNALIHAFNDEEGYLLDYDYSDFTGGFITRIDYDSHPVVKSFIKQIRVSDNAFVEFKIKDKELADWKKFRIKGGQRDDPRLNKASAIHYYVYSVGSASIGISAFDVINEEKLELLRRFRNAFDFAYRRYMDVAQAEAQTREAQIETALERVRGKALAMHKSEELYEVVSSLKKELDGLNIKDVIAATIYLEQDDGSIRIVDLTTGADQTAEHHLQMDRFFRLEDTDPKLWVRRMWSGKEKYFVIEVDEEDFKRVVSWLHTVDPGEAKTAERIIRENKIKKAWLPTVRLEKGRMNIDLLQPPTPEIEQIMLKLGAGFDLAYRRFLDLQKAESQVLESKIQLALERVRARTMAMQKSDELLETSKVLFQQLESLGQPAEQLTIGIINEKKRVFEISATFHGNQLAQTFNSSIDEPYLTSNVYTGWKQKLKSQVLEIKGKDLAAYNKYRNELVGEKKFPTRIGPNESWVAHVAFFSNGMLTLSAKTRLPQESVQLLERFASVFDLTYTRFLDLKKAEMQTREARIETALEKVRSRTMAMQKSDELPEAAILLFQQVQLLGVPAWAAGYCIWDEDKKGITLWMSSEGILEPSFHAPTTEDPSFIHFREAWERGESFFVEEIGREELAEHYQYMRKLPGVGKILDAIIEAGHPLPIYQIFHLSYFSKGFLLFITYEPVPLEHDIFKRFGKVFEQTYGRFLDLQKAEAQAREAQIEVGLERVRAKAMAMHKTDDIHPAVAIVFEEMEKLNLGSIRCGIGILNRDKMTGDVWTIHQSEEGDKVLVSGNEAMDIHPLLEGDYKAWLNNEDFSYVLQGEDLVSYYRAVNESDFHLPESQLILEANKETKQYYYVTPFEAGTLFAFRNTEFPEEAKSVMKRFANVFNLTYKRFLDLQKAEAQAREAKVESALERVRSKTMAMHTSQDVAETVSTLFNELLKLGVKIYRCGIGIMHETGPMELWTARPGIQEKVDLIIGHIDMTSHPLFRGALAGWKNKDESFSYELRDNDLIEYYTALNNQPDYPVKYDLSTLPARIFHHDFYFNEGTLFVFSLEALSVEESSVLKRFTAVFGQTYRRFLDLQKAEAQAREAQIEVGLERVRAKAMAMHKSDDLNAAVSVVFEELAKLNLDVMRCGIGIMDREKRHADVWVTTITDEGPVVQVAGDESFDIHPLLTGAFDAWASGKPEYSYTLEGQDLVDYYKALGPTNFHLPESQMKLSNISSEKQYYNLAPFEAGGLFAFRKEPFPDEARDVMRRFASVFNLTYKRFLDIQKAEAQARESQIEVSLERVRAKAMAMHSSEELASTITTFYHEIETLTLTPIRCGVAIIDQETRIAEVSTMNTTEKGESIVVMGHIKMEGHRILEEVFDHWLKQKEYHAILRGSEIKEYYKVLRPQIEFPDYPHDEVQYGYYFMFKEGDVYAWTEKPLKEEQLKIYRRFTTVLSLTFKRYNDLKHAEAQAREANIEVALERVRARALAMQEPEELKDVAQVLRNEMGTLGVEELETASIYIHERDSDTAECWYALKDPTDTSKKMVSDNFHLNMNETWVGREMKKFYLSDEKQVSVVMHGNNRKEWIEYCYKHSPVFSGFYGNEIPDRTYHLYKFSHGYIGAAAPGDISAESWRLLSRAASVFSLAYSRFKDLTQARIDLQRLKEEKQRAESALTELKSTQTQLIQAEKMASLGELTAGIAHEIQNPLNFVNNFSEVSNELIAEMKDELAKGNNNGAIQLVEDVKQNLDKINFHGKRADAIVKSMLQHSRKSTGQKEPTDINALADEYLRLAYHGFRAKDKSFNAKFEINLDDSIGKMNVVPQEIGRVILNLINNAFYAVSEKKKQNLAGYEPIVTVSTIKSNGNTEIKVQDNGNGIPQQSLDKIFQPFFTTKPTGQGTGLGLSLSYDIVTKGHGGELKVNTKEGEGTEFVIQLPS
jgi:signal transduction histidine kinase